MIVVLHVARSEQDACIAQQHVTGRVRPAGSPPTSPPDPDQTRRTRRTAGPVRRERRQPGPGSAQEPVEPPLREAGLLGDAVPHASCSCSQYRSTGWGRPCRTGAGRGRDQFAPVTRRTGWSVTAATVRKSRSSVRIVSRCRSAVTLMRRSTGPAERWWPVSVSRCWISLARA